MKTANTSLIFSALLLLGLSSVTYGQKRLLHVPSPDWRDQVIYFLMIDRFADGDPSNNDQGVGLFDPTQESHYSGGDLRGIIDRLDYIEQLGATAVWTTPQVANMWWDPQTNYGGYHGYWARDFKAVDEHYGSLDDYKDLSHALHSRGMYLIQDVVVNHVGNYFSYRGPYDPENLTKNVVLNTEAIPSGAPTQFPFNQVDVTNPLHRQANIYNWTPDIQDFSDPLQETRYQTATLSDLNTRNPVVVEALKDSFGFWVEQTGVDAFRIDTVKYVEPEFYEEFLHGEGGIYPRAKSTGRDNFFTFGEVFNTSLPLQNEGEVKLAKYMSSKGSKKIDAPIGFPLYKEMQRVFAGGQPTHYLSYRLRMQMEMFDQPYLVTNFIDNHDVERFLAGGSTESLKLAYTLLMTIPGIPMIYQGDEQGFTTFRRAMFAGGHQNKKDQFDVNSDMYQFIQKLAHIRRGNNVFSRGRIEILADNSVGAGVFAYARYYEGKAAYVVLNTSTRPTLLNQLSTPFSKTNKASVLFSHHYESSLEFDLHGRLTAVLPPQSAIVFMGKDVEQTQIEEAADITFEQIRESYTDQKEAIVRGRVSQPKAELLAVIDGDLSSAKPLKANNQGQWSFAMLVRNLGEQSHFIEIYWPEKNKISEKKYYTVVNSEPELLKVAPDPLGDAKGVSGNYIPPQHTSIGCAMDLTGVEARAGGEVLELTLTMCEISDLWSPPNQFDHVAFTIFFDLDASQGKRELSVIGGTFPEKGRWDIAHVAYGWGNYLYSHQGATEKEEGRKIGVSPNVTVDKKNKRITFRYHAKNLDIKSWENATIYITTWDKDGGGVYRPLGSEAGEWSFGGGTPESPKIMDDALVKLSPNH